MTAATDATATDATATAAAATAVAETHRQKHARLAGQLLAQADHKIMTGDLLQSSAKLWGATSHALKAFCESRGWGHGEYAQRAYAVKRLAAEKPDDESIIPAFRVAASCHANFYNDWMEFEDVDENRVIVRRLVEKILAEAE